MSVRIHSIAKEIGVENKELVKILQDRGYDVKTPSSTIDNISAEALLEEYKAKEPEQSAESASTPTEEAPKPAGEATEKVAPPPVVGPKSAPELPKGPIVRTAADIAAAKIAPPKAAPPPPPSRPLPPVAVKAPPQPPVPPVRRPGAPAPTPVPVPPVRSSAPSPAPVPPLRSATPAPVVPPLRSASPAPTPPVTKPAPLPPPVAKAPPQAPSVKVPPSNRNTPAPVPASAVDSAGGEAGEGGDTAAPESNLKRLVLKPPIVVRDFASQIGLKPFKLISELMDRGIFASLHQAIDEEVAAKLAERHGFYLEIRHRGDQIAAQKKAIQAEEEDDTKFLEPRPPVACILGHVDHGKTTLIDAIRKSSVVEDEFGGITQHIGAYQVEHNSKKITFLDTPGHAAFSKMRERGADLTDVAIVVVAADDGFKPQTDEALKFAKRSQVEIIVAVTKMDVKGANLDRVKTQMQERGIPPEDWGGTTITVPVAALKGQGIDDLLEMILLQTEVMELRANPRGKSRGIVIEAQMEVGIGATATVIIDKGTLRPGDALVCGTTSCRVRALHDANGKAVKEAPPGTPVKVLGWADVPDTGQTFFTVKNEREAKSKAEENLDAKLREEEEMAASLKSKATPEDNLAALFGAIESVQKRALRVVLKADVKGSLEAVIDAVKEIKSDKIDLKVVGSGVGPITKKDVTMANAVGAAIFGFNVAIENGVRGLAKHDNVNIYQDNIIYSLLDTVRDAMAELLEPELREKKVGMAEVRMVFPLGKRHVAGCMVTEGKIVRNAQARLMRGGEIIHESRIESLKRFKDDATEVKAGYECGIRLDKFDKYREGDSIEVLEIEKIRPAL